MSPALEGYATADEVRVPSRMLEVGVRKWDEMHGMVCREGCDGGPHQAEPLVLDTLDLDASRVTMNVELWPAHTVGPVPRGRAAPQAARPRGVRRGRSGAVGGRARRLLRLIESIRHEITVDYWEAYAGQIDPRKPVNR